MTLASSLSIQEHIPSVPMDLCVASLLRHLFLDVILCHKGQVFISPDSPPGLWDLGFL